MVPRIGLISETSKGLQQQGLLVAAVLAEGSQGIVPVRVLNMGDRRVQLQPGQEITIYQKVEAMSMSEGAAEVKARKDGSERMH